MNKSAKVTTSQQKTNEYKQQGNKAMVLLYKSQKLKTPLSIPLLMSFLLTPVPPSLGTSGGYLTKTNKAAGFNHLVKDVEDAELPPVGETLIIQDGNAKYHELREIPSDFTKIAQKVYYWMPSGSDLVFNTDMYLQNSIKCQERIRRGTGEKLVISQKTKKPKDWKLFLTNDANKQQLSSILCDVW